MTYFEIYTRVRFLNETMLSAGHDSRNAKFFRLISWHVFQLFSFLLFFYLMEVAEEKKTARVVWCFCWMGGFFLCKLSRRFGHQFSQSDRFIVTSCWVWGIYTHLSAPRLFSESTKDMILQVFQQNNPLTATCHSNVPRSLYSGRWLNCQGKNGEEGALTGQNHSAGTYFHLYYRLYLI